MPDGFDPSIILGPQQNAQANGPLNALIGAAQTGNALYNFQKQGADVLAGQDFQKAIGPNGQLDVPTFNKLLATQPGAALAAIKSGQDAQTNQATALSNQTTEISNTASRIGYISNLFTGYAENAPTMKSFQSDIADGIHQGIIDPQMGAQILATTPDPSSPEFAPFAKAEAQHMSAAAGQIARFLPQPETLDYGSGAAIINASPLTNPGLVGTNITYGPTPQEQMTTGSVNLPGGGQQVGTLPQLARVVGGTVPQGGVTPAGAPSPNGSFGAPIPQVNAGPGRIYPAAQPAGNSPAGGFAPSPAPAPSMPGAPSSTGLNIPAGTSQIAQNDADYFTGALGNQQAAAATVPALRNLLAAAPGAQTGPAAADIATLSSVLNEFGINVGSDQATQEQNLTKNGVQLVAGLAQKLGTPTDAKMMEAALGSPNASLTEGAIRTIGAEMTGTAALANATANALQAARAQGISPGTLQFAALRSALNNPMLGTAFQFPYLDPSARGRVINALGGMKSAEAQHLLSQLNFAYQLEPGLPSLRGGN